MSRIGGGEHGSFGAGGFVDTCGREGFHLIDEGLWSIARWAVPGCDLQEDAEGCHHHVSEGVVQGAEFKGQFGGCGVVQSIENLPKSCMGGIGFPKHGERWEDRRGSAGEFARKDVQHWRCGAVPKGRFNGAFHPCWLSPEWDPFDYPRPHGNFGIHLWRARPDYRVGTCPGSFGRIWRRWCILGLRRRQFLIWRSQPEPEAEVPLSECCLMGRRPQIEKCHGKTWEWKGTVNDLRINLCITIWLSEADISVASGTQVLAKASVALDGTDMSSCGVQCKDSLPKLWSSTIVRKPLIRGPFRNCHDPSWAHLVPCRSLNHPDIRYPKNLMAFPKCISFITWGSPCHMTWISSVRRFNPRIPTERS